MKPAAIKNVVVQGLHHMIALAVSDCRTPLMYASAKNCAAKLPGIDLRTDQVLVGIVDKYAALPGIMSGYAQFG